MHWGATPGDGIQVNQMKYQLGLYEKAIPAGLSWDEKLEVARKLNYGYVELSIDETNDKLARLD